MKKLALGDGCAVCVAGRRVARTLSYAEGAPSSVFEGGSCVWVLSNRSANSLEASE